MVQRAAAIALCTFAAVVSSLDGAPLRDEAQEASTAHLKRALQTQRDGSHLAMLLALRQLRDPEMRPLFERLLAHDEWHVQVHAALGLAEISRSGQIDVSHIASAAPLAQEAAVANALDLELLGKEQIPQLLTSEALDPMAKLLLYAERASLGEEINLEALRELSKHREFRIAAMASLLLAHAGETAALEQHHVKLKADSRTGARRLIWILDAVRQYRLKAVEPWVRTLLRESNLDQDVIDAAVFSLVVIEPQRNVEVWRTHLGRGATLLRRVKYGLMLLSAGKEVPQRAYDWMAGDDELTLLLASAGRSISSGKDASSAIIELMNFGHARSLEWAVSAANDLPDSQAKRVYLHVLDRLIEADGVNDPRQRGMRAEWIASGIKAATRLFELDVDAITERLHQSDAAGQARKAILLGMLESDDPKASEVARTLDLSGFGLSESLAFLLIARHADQLTAAELDRLGLMASGGGRLSDDLRAQASWLYLKRSGRLAHVLPELLQE